MKKAEPNKSPPEASPERANFAPILHAVARVVVAHRMLICVVSLPNNRQFLHVDSAALKLLHRLVRFRMRAIHRDN